MRDSLEKLELELSGEEQPANGYSRDDLKALAEWWDDFDKRAVSVPVKGKLPTVAHLYQDPMSDEAALLMDARDVNIMLHHLGAKVVLCWDTTRVTLANGKTQNRYKLAQARFFLGRKNVIKLKVPPSEETMHIILAAPRGFCAGVNMAVESLNLAIQAFGTPIYVYHEIVHNRWVVEHFRRQGVVFVDDLSQVPHSAHLLYSAHGVPPEIRRQAALQNLITIDATCPLVTKVHAEAIRFASQGYTIILIGHAGHDEVVGTLGEAPQSIVLVQSPDDVGRLDLPDTVKVAYLTQTTLSVDDAANIIGRLRQRFPHIVGPVREDVCYATQHRQEAVRTLAREADMVIVVGSCNSSNSQRLAEMARSQGTPAHLIDGPDDIDFTWFTGGETIAVTAGASAPDAVVRRCVALLKERFNATIESRVAKEEQIRFTLPEPLRGI
jgi:4-hydroxy-3-methylbut-2-enyl diphosphate reductase